MTLSVCSMNDVKRSSATSTRSEKSLPKASVRTLVVTSKASEIDFNWFGIVCWKTASFLAAVVALLMAEEVTLLEERNVESEAWDWVTFDKEVAEDRRMTSVDDSGVLIEHEADSAMALEVEGTTRLNDEGEVTDIAVVRES